VIGSNNHVGRIICSTTSSDKFNSYSAGVADRNIDLAQVLIFDAKLAR
jgi:hypothetical protein